MESTPKKTFARLRTKLSVAAVLTFILLNYPALSVADQDKVVCISDGDTFKVENNGKTNIIRLVGTTVPEPSEKKIEAVKPFNQKSTKHSASLVLNQYVEIESYFNNPYGRNHIVAYVDCKNVNLEAVFSSLLVRFIKSLIS